MKTALLIISSPLWIPFYILFLGAFSIWDWNRINEGQINHKKNMEKLNRKLVDEAFEEIRQRLDKMEGTKQ